MGRGTRSFWIVFLNTAPRYILQYSVLKYPAASQQVSEHLAGCIATHPMNYESDNSLIGQFIKMDVIQNHSLLQVDLLDCTECTWYVG